LQDFLELLAWQGLVNAGVWLLRNGEPYVQLIYKIVLGHGRPLRNSWNHSRIPQFESGKGRKKSRGGITRSQILERERTHFSQGQRKPV